VISVKIFKHGQIGFGPSMIKSLFGPEKRRQLEDKVKRRGLTLLDMNKNVLVTPKEVCLLSVHRIRQDGIDGLEPGSFERRPLSNDVLFGPSMMLSLGVPVRGNMVNATKSIDNHVPGSASMSA